MADIKNFTIQVSMNERWVDDFCSFLKYMEHCGRIGHSSLVSFFADGDGDFRPEFQFDICYNTKEGIPGNKLASLPEFMWDAG